MKKRYRAALAGYVLLIFVTLPLLPPVAGAVRDGLGEGPFLGLILGILALVGAAPLARLRRAPAQRRPGLAGSYALLLALGGAVGLSLVSSPVGAVHLAEYSLLGFLVIRALPEKLDGRTAFVVAFCGAALTGLLDETVQHFLPNRVFDWYDVGLNGGASLLGVLLSRWWDAAGRPGERPSEVARERRKAADDIPSPP
jgi:hypothetical protein